jgi:hypothetical protein
VEVLRRTEGNRNPRNFSCGKARFFHGECVAASGFVKNAVAMILRKIFRRFAFVR